MAFTLSRDSETKLIGVHPDLARVVRRAIQLTEIDFKVGEGVRSVQRQKELYDSGKSQTLKSRHITGHAVDLWPVGQDDMWDMEHYYRIAKAMKYASIECKVPIRWGCVWDMRLAQLSDIMKLEVSAYRNRRKKLGKGTFVDGPHFELPESEYPV